MIVIQLRGAGRGRRRRRVRAGREHPEVAAELVGKLNAKMGVGEAE